MNVRVTSTDGALGIYKFGHVSELPICLHAVEWPDYGVEEFESERAFAAARRRESVLDLSLRERNFHKRFDLALALEDKRFQPDASLRRLENILNTNLLSHLHMTAFTIPAVLDPRMPLNAVAGHMLAYFVENNAKEYLELLLGVPSVHSVERQVWGHPFDSLLNGITVRLSSLKAHAVLDRS